MPHFNALNCCYFSMYMPTNKKYVEKFEIKQIVLFKLNFAIFKQISENQKN